MPIRFEYPNLMGDTQRYGEAIIEIAQQNARITAERNQRTLDRISDAVVTGTMHGLQLREQRATDRIQQADAMSKMRLGHELNMEARRSEFDHDIEMFSNRSAFESAESELDRSLRRGEGAKDRSVRLTELFEEVTGRKLDREQRKAFEDADRSERHTAFRRQFAAGYGMTAEEMDQFRDEAENRGVSPFIALAGIQAQNKARTEAFEQNLLNLYGTNDPDVAMQRDAERRKMSQKTGKDYIWDVKPEAQQRLDGIERQRQNLMSDPRAADPAFVSSMNQALDEQEQRLQQGAYGWVELQPRSMGDMYNKGTFTAPGAGVWTVDSKGAMVNRVKWGDTEDGKRAAWRHDTELENTKRAAQDAQDKEKAKREYKSRAVAAKKILEAQRKEGEKYSTAPIAPVTKEEIAQYLRDEDAMAGSIADELLGETAAGDEPSAVAASERVVTVSGGPDDGAQFAGTKAQIDEYVAEMKRQGHTVTVNDAE